jgi:flagellar motor switch protein FliN/FliY
MATVEEEKAQTAPVNDGLDLSGAETSGGDPSAKETDGAALKSAGDGSPDNFEFILDIPLQVTVELGRTKMLVNELLKLGQGSVIELTKLAGESLEILVNQKAIARGEVVVVNDKYGIRLTEVISPMERLERLK